MPKKRKDLFVPLPDGFRVSTPRDNLKGDRFDWVPTGLFIVFGHARAESHYAGEKAGDSGIQFDIPAEPDFLREFGRLLIQKADELDS